MIRKSFVLQLRPGCEQEYERRHRPIWPELAATLRAHGVACYSIHLHPGTLQLFALAEVEDAARWEQIADTEVCRRWWQHMAPLMVTQSDGRPTSIDLRLVFDLDSCASSPASLDS